MKQLCEKRKQVRIGNGEWKDLVIPKLRYANAGVADSQLYQDFDYAYLTFKDCEWYGIDSYKIFGKDRIRIELIGGLDGTFCMTKKKFVPFEVRIIYEPIYYIYSFKNLMQELPAEQFVEYCKDNSLAVVIGG